MDKVVLDTFDPEVSCFDPPPTSPHQQDPCKVTATFHNGDDPNVTQPAVSFQREKDHYVIDPSLNPSILAVLQGLGFNEKDSSVQGALHFSIFMNRTHRKYYNSFKSVSQYNGPDLLPASKRMVDFMTAGNIENPDEKQRKAAAQILKEILPYKNPEQDWFLRPLKNLLNETPSDDDKSSAPFLIPVPIRPRVQWMRDQFKIYEELRSLSSPAPDAALQKKFEGFALSLLIYLVTGEGNLAALKTDLDNFSGAFAVNFPNDPERKDLFAALSKKLNSYGQNPFFAKNPEAARRMAVFSGHLREAVEIHRSELVSLGLEGGYHRSLKYKLIEAAASGQLALRVKSEMEAAGLSNGWLQSHIEELSEAVLPAVKLVQEPGKPPRAKVDVSGLMANVDLLVRSHYIQAREYRVGVLAVLRTLFGNSLASPKMEGWVNDGFKSMEIDMTADQSKKFFEFRDRLNEEISKSVKSTSVALPVAEGILTAAGAALTIGGRADSPSGRTPLNVIGPAVLGLGGAALLCHLVLKTRNQYISDGLCGLVGAGLGLTVGLLTTQDGEGKKDLSRETGRNPSRGFGP